MRRGMKELSGVMVVFYISLEVWVIKVFLKTNLRLVYSTVFVYPASKEKIRNIKHETLMTYSEVFREKSTDICNLLQNVSNKMDCCMDRGINRWTDSKHSKFSGRILTTGI